MNEEPTYHELIDYLESLGFMKFTFNDYMTNMFKDNYEIWINSEDAQSYRFEMCRELEADSQGYQQYKNLCLFYSKDYNRELHGGKHSSFTLIDHYEDIIYFIGG